MDTNDLMRGLIKLSFDIYNKPIEFMFDESKFGIVDGAMFAGSIAILIRKCTESLK